MKPRHKWIATEHSAVSGTIFRCSRCETERTRDVGTNSLYLYRGGRAISPRGLSMKPYWTGFKAGVTPRCVEGES